MAISPKVLALDQVSCCTGELAWLNSPSLFYPFSKSCQLSCKVFKYIEQAMQNLWRCLNGQFFVTTLSCAMSIHPSLVSNAIAAILSSAHLYISSSKLLMDCLSFKHLFIWPRNSSLTSRIFLRCLSVCFFFRSGPYPKIQFYWKQWRPY